MICRDLSNTEPPEAHPWTVRIEPFEGIGIKIRYPREFIESTKRKFVRVLGVDLIVVARRDIHGHPLRQSTYTRPDCFEVRAGFNQESDDSDFFVCFTNQKLVKPKDYEQYTTLPYFWIAFYSSLQGGFISPREEDTLILQLELIY